MTQKPVTPELARDTLAAAERALTDALQTGELGYPMMNAQARMFDAKFDPQLSSEDSFVAAAVVFVLFGPKLDANAGEPEDDELDMQFMPGELMRKGEQMDPEDIPEKIIVEETVAAEAKTETKVTTDEKATPNPEPKKNDKPKDDIKSTEKPDPNKKNVKESDNIVITHH